MAQAGFYGDLELKNYSSQCIDTDHRREQDQRRKEAIVIN
jgi:hypothetical protein